MKCEQIRDQILDLMTAAGPLAPEVEAHLGSCPACAAELKSMRQTMSLLDEWEAPEPSPFFDTRLKARVREIQVEAAQSGWFLRWIRRPVLAATAAAALIVGVGAYQGIRYIKRPAPPVVIVDGSPVNDLQTLQQDQDMLSNFDALDDGDGTPDNVQ